jgi:hypothetical protein
MNQQEIDRIGLRLAMQEQAVRLQLALRSRQEEKFFGD